MMGRSHVASGLAAGVMLDFPFSHGREMWLPGMLPVIPAPVAVMAVMVMGAAALLPDIDHPSSTIAHSLGFVTVMLSRLVHWVSLEVYHSTAGPRDKQDKTNGHRLITHTPVGSLAFGVIVTGAVLVHPAGAAVIVGLMTALVANGFKRGLGWSLLVMSGGAAWWVTASYPGWWWIWGVATALGAHIHREGDWCTVAGVPRRSWPLMIDGKRWDTHRANFAFQTDGDEENSVVRPAFYVATVLATAVAVGLAPVIVEVIGHVVTALRSVRG